MTHMLDSRVLRILRWLLDQEGFRSTASLGADLGLSQRVIRYRLDAVARFLESEGLTLVRQRGTGLGIEGPDHLRESLRDRLSEEDSTLRVYARDERQHILVSALLSAAPEAVSLEELGESLEVSKASARRDLRRAEEWLELRGLLVVRRPGVGGQGDLADAQRFARVFRVRRAGLHRAAQEPLRLQARGVRR